MKKKVQVVMLSTNEKSLIYKFKGADRLGCSSILSNHSKAIPQHLYFLSDEKIEMGDWFVDLESKEFYRSYGVMNGLILIKPNSSIGCNPSFCKSIIATTNQTLNNLSEPSKGKYGGIRYTEFYELPKPSESFIKKYIKEFNKGNQITEVMVEYEGVVQSTTWEHDEPEYWRLKVDNNNEITITKVKDSWDREEIETLLRSMYKFGWNGGYEEALGKFESKMHDCNSVSKWIEKNL